MFDQLGDPMASEGAPRLVSFGEIKIANQPEPGAYPPSAKANGIQGDILVEVWIDPSGVPIKASALWGRPELREKAVEYALRWKFRAYISDGQPTPVRFRMVMPFRLLKGGPIDRLPQNWRF